jgi:hypothetical protein
MNGRSAQHVRRQTDELADAYVQGRLSRRVIVKGLVALGLSLPAAGAKELRSS